jgi:hypothetical protein
MSDDSSVAPARRARHGRRVLVYVVLALCCLDRAVAANEELWRSYDPHFGRERIRYARRVAWDLVVVGGSPAMAGINAGDLASLGWHGRVLSRAYNLSIPLGTTADVFHAVEHGLPRPPTLLVHGIAITDLNDVRLEAMGPENLMDGRDVLRWLRLRPGDAEWCLRHRICEQASQCWSLFYHRQGIRLWAAERMESLCAGFCPDAARQAANGLENSEALRRCLDFHPCRPVPDRLRYDLKKAAGELPCRIGAMENYRIGHYLPYLDAIADWAEYRRTTLILVDMPVPADLERLYPQAFEAYRSALAQFQRHRGVRLLIAQRAELGLTDGDFDDMIHLNGDGTARFTIWLRNTLSDRASNGSEKRINVRADQAKGSGAVSSAGDAS